MERICLFVFLNLAMNFSHFLFRVIHVFQVRILRKNSLIFMNHFAFFAANLIKRLQIFSTLLFVFIKRLKILVEIADGILIQHLVRYFSFLLFLFTFNKNISGSFDLIIIILLNQDWIFLVFDTTLGQPIDPDLIFF